MSTLFIWSVFYGVEVFEFVQDLIEKESLELLSSHLEAMFGYRRSFHQK